jgi:hypothetical protein
MPTELNRQAFSDIVEEDIKWLEKQPRTLERCHIIDVLRKSVEWRYGTQSAPTDAEKADKT